MCQLQLLSRHSLQIVHLDIKPDNILVGRHQGCYKIADLGLAAAAMGTGCDDITEGDCRYLAKEVLRGELRNLDLVAYSPCFVRIHVVFISSFKLIYSFDVLILIGHDMDLDDIC